MSSRRITPKEQVFNYIMNDAERRIEVLIKSYIYVGESCIREGRLGGTYQDQTGNLRSSIGYVVLRDGRIVQKGGFQQVKQGSKGSSEGEKFLEELISKHSKGIVLIVVAGMSYSAYVEAKGYNVLTSAELLAEELVPQILKQVGFIVK